MQLKLPQPCWLFPYFKTDSQVVLLIRETLYSSFTPLGFKPIKTLDKGFWALSSYYSRGTLYYHGEGEGISSLAIGDLTSL
jgi:hypothetical protein